MQEFKEIKDFEKVKDRALKEYLKDKYIKMLKEYHCDMSAIGEVILFNNAGEFFKLYGRDKLDNAEVTEIVTVGNSDYTHIVYIVSDSFAEDVFCKGDVI